MQQATGRPINVNFFVHKAPVADAAREAGWRKRLGSYYREFGLPADAGAGGPVRAPFDAALCDVVLEFKPKVASFHFGLPDAALVKRLKAEKIVVISSATTAAEARWLEAHGCDAVIAQGAEAGGHRGMFLTDDVASQAGTMALVPQVVDAVKVPVIAAGGIGDGRGIAAALALGAAGAQIGTAFLLTPEARPWLCRAALKTASDSTTLTNLFTNPARGIIIASSVKSALSADAPAFPLAAAAAFPLRAAAGPKLDRFHAIVERTGAVAGASAVGGDCRPGERDRSRSQARTGMTASIGGDKPRVIGAWPIAGGRTTARRSGPARGRYRMDVRPACPRCSVPAAGARRRGCGR